LQCQGGQLYYFFSFRAKNCNFWRFQLTYLNNLENIGTFLHNILPGDCPRLLFAASFHSFLLVNISSIIKVCFLHRFLFVTFSISSLQAVPFYILARIIRAVFICY
jgi:hypothetical protein